MVGFAAFPARVEDAFHNFSWDSVGLLVLSPLRSWETTQLACTQAAAGRAGRRDKEEEMNDRRGGNARGGTLEEVMEGGA